MTTPAATEAYGLSPTLLAAQSSKFPSPLPLHHRVLGQFLAFFCSSAFYIGPILLLAPAAAYLIISRTASIYCLLANLAFVYYPHREWPQIRFLFQLWYELFDFHHNVTVETKKTSREGE